MGNSFKFYSFTQVIRLIRLIRGCLPSVVDNPAKIIYDKHMDIDILKKQLFGDSGVKSIKIMCVLAAMALLLQGCMLLPTFESYEDYRGDWYEQDVRDAEENME